MMVRKSLRKKLVSTGGVQKIHKNKLFHINPLLFNEINEWYFKKMFQNSEGILVNTCLLSLHCALGAGTMAVGRIPACA